MTSLPAVRFRLLMVLLLLRATSATAQATAADQTPGSRGVPFFLSVQVGGGAGMVALGGGVRLAGQRLEPEVLLGRVPRRFSGQPLTVFTFKTTYLPVRARLSQQWQAGAGLGGYASYTTGAALQNSKQPDKYPNHYYWFSSRIRTGFYVAPRLAYAGTRGSAPLRAAAYAELGTNDLYLISRTTNRRGPSLAELLTLGVGSKLAW